MKEWNNLSDHDRILAWREFRLSILELDTETKINKVSEFFSSVPISSRYIDYYTPESWPNPWEILHNRWSCSSSISLLIAHTLALTGVTADICLAEYSGDIGLLPIVGDLVLNYELGKAVLLSTIHDLKIVARYNINTIQNRTE